MYYFSEGLNPGKNKVFLVMRYLTIVICTDRKIHSIVLYMRQLISYALVFEKVVHGLWVYRVVMF